MRQKKFNYLLALIISMMLTTTFCFSQSVPDSCTKLRNTKTDVSGVFRFQYTPVFCDTAFSILGELGSENYRANLTLAQEKWNCLRYKVTGEYLAQRHQYEFTNSSKKKWVDQVAGGLAAQYLLNCSMFSSLDLAADYSYAFSKDLSNINCNEEELGRRIAGSNFYNVRGGATLSSFCSGLFSFWINYDSGKYQREYRNDKDVKGFGGGFLLDQPLGEQFGLVVIGDIKRPYQYYEVQLNWEKCACGGLWKVGAYSSYTDGRTGLNNDVKIGGQITFIGGASSRSSSGCCETACCRNSFSRWASLPAVYRPIVLAIPEQEAPEECPLPTIIGNPPTIDNFLEIFQLLPMDPFDFSQFVSGTGLTYAMSGQPIGISIDPITGVISGTTPQSGNFITTITITNACGSIQYVFQIFSNETN